MICHKQREHNWKKGMKNMFKNTLLHNEKQSTSIVVVLWGCIKAERNV